MKRIIFTLLYCDGNFMLSRNFRLQKVGSIEWVFKNYDIENITNYIDELMLINLSKEKNSNKLFLDNLKKLSKKTFIPIVAGGKIESEKDVESLLDSGADKVLINTLFFKNPKICETISKRYGKQFLIGSIDYTRSSKKVKVFDPSIGKFSTEKINNWIDHLLKFGAGEILLQSIDRDGTGNGLDLQILKLVNKKKYPLILMGGVGNYDHIVGALKKNYIDAVSTANIFNFIGNEFLNIRQVLEKKIGLPKKINIRIQNFKHFFK
jgi:imidazole glycerol-phosphate synthase subunit HisF